jgi:ubiquitin-protein ligase
MNHIYCFPHIIGLLSQTSSLTEQISPSTMKRVFREIMELRSSSVCHGPSAIFSIDDTPFDGDEDINPRPLYVSGRIRPSSNIYNQREYTIKITFPPSYPFNPPEVRFITPMYHPNISSNGE